MNETAYINNYIQSADGNVYKVLQNHCLKLSPWNDGDDRRVYEFENDDYKVITYQTACMIVNKQFAETDERWEFNGKKYIARKVEPDKTDDERAALLSLLPSHTVRDKTADLLKELPNGQSLSIHSDDGRAELKLVRHKGKIYYMLVINENLPRVQMYDLFGKFCSWAHIKNVKPIFCETDKRYI